MKAIFIPSIQHTGTWFLLHLLRNHSSNKSGHMLNHEHLQRILIDKSYVNLVFSEDTTLIHFHFGEGEAHFPDDRAKHFPYELVEYMASIFPTVIPLRDPLLSLISRQARYPDLDHSYLINGFVYLVQLSQKFRPFILPIDVLAKHSDKQRYGELADLMKHLGLDLEPYLALWSVSWSVFNPTSAIAESENNEEMKTALSLMAGYYETGDVGKLYEIFPEEYDYLKSHEPLLKPFLKELGYRDLAWWEAE